MKTIYKQDLEEDVLVNEYVDLNTRIYLKDGEFIEDSITGYTYDDEPFCNYILINDMEILFEDIHKVEILD